MPFNKSAETRAEIQRAYRQRKLADNSEVFREKERQRWIQRRAEGKVASVADMTERQRRAARKKWREQRAGLRAKKRMMESESAQTSSTTGMASSHSHSRQSLAGRRTVRKDRAKAYRRIQHLEELLDQAARVKDKYRKKYELLKQRVEKAAEGSSGSPTELAVEGGCPETPANCYDTPRTKTKKLLQGCHWVTPKVRKTLLLHSVMMKDLKEQKHLKYRVPPAAKSHLMKKLHLSSFARQSGTGLLAARRDRAKCADVVDDETRSVVQEFFVRDDNLRITTGRKQTVTGKKEKRLLLDTLENLHETFCAEYINNIISYCTFTRLR